MGLQRVNYPFHGSVASSYNTQVISFGPAHYGNFLNLTCHFSVSHTLCEKRSQIYNNRAQQIQ